MLSRRQIVYACIAIGLVVFAYSAWYRAGASLYNQFSSGVPDDAAYYLKPALNYALGHGSSFDGINPTNGYQPLWFVLLVLFFKLLPLKGMTLAGIWYAACWLQAAIFGAFTSLFCYALYRLTQSPALALLFGFLPALLFPNRILNLLETPLQLLIFVIVLIQCINILEKPAYEDFRERLALLGLTVGALFLARTDGIFMAPALCLPLIIKFQRKRRRMLWFLVPVGLIVMLYWVVNYVNFGVVMPTSGTIKLDQTHMLMARHAGWDFVVQKLKFIFGPYDLGTPPYKILIQVFAFFLPLTLLVKHFRNKILSNRELILIGLGAFLLCKYIGYTVIYHGSRTSAYWYWVVDVVVWITAGAVAARRILAHLAPNTYVMYARRTMPILVAVLLLFSFIRGVTVRAAAPAKPVRDTSVLLDLAAFLNQHADYFSQKRIGSFNSGILGYFSGLPITNLDGLINSPAYANIVATGKREAFIASNFDMFVEYHSAYVPYYTGLGFTVYTIAKYVPNAVPFNAESGDDYRVYIRHGQEPGFEAFLKDLNHSFQ